MASAIIAIGIITALAAVVAVPVVIAILPPVAVRLADVAIIFAPRLPGLARIVGLANILAIFLLGLADVLAIFLLRLVRLRQSGRRRNNDGGHRGSQNQIPHERYSSYIPPTRGLRQ